MKICYLVHDTELLTGANKIIYEHANGLSKKGHKVAIISHGRYPKWYKVNAKIITVPKKKLLSDYVPNTDIVVCTYYTNAIETIKAAKKWHALSIYFFQGDNHIFNYSKFDFSSAEKEKDLAYNAFKLPFYQIICYSKQARKILFNKFNIKPTVITNSIDKNTFKYKATPKNKKIRIIVLGTDLILTKGISDIYEALNIVKEKGYQFELIRVSGYKQSFYYLDSKFYLSPTQKKIAELLNSSDIFISASYWETWGLPSFESMACGTAVITSDNGGVKEYAIDGYNCLMFKIGNVNQLAEKIIKLIEDEKLRSRLIKNGLKTVKRFNWEEIITTVENIFNKALMTDNRLYFKKLDKFNFSIQESAQITRTSKEKLFKHLFEINKFFLENKIKKDGSCKLQYYLAKIHFDLALFLLQERRIIDKEIITLLNKAKILIKKYLLNDKVFIKDSKHMLDIANILTLYKDKNVTSKNIIK